MQTAILEVRAGAGGDEAARAEGRESEKGVIDLTTKKLRHLSAVFLFFSILA